MTVTNEDDFWKTLQHELTNAARDISRLRSEIDPSDQRAIFFLSRLMIACENTVGCILLGKSNLAAPLATVGRSLFESVISTYWASLNGDNADHMMESETQELLRIMKNNLLWGRAKIIHTETGVVETHRVLNHPAMKQVKGPRRFDHMAREAGIKNIYDQLYGFLSMMAHGTATNVMAKSQLEGNPPVYEIMSLVRGCLKSIHLIVSNRLPDGKQTAIADLERILKVKLSS